MTGRLADPLPQLRQHLFGLGVAAGGLLGKDEIVVERDLEDASSGGHDAHLVELVLEFGKNQLRQTDGFR